VSFSVFSFSYIDMVWKRWNIRQIRLKFATTISLIQISLHQKIDSFSMNAEVLELEGLHLLEAL
jgi:hypothetical protein